jgi:2-phosphoglycerate kinase
MLPVADPSTVDWTVLLVGGASGVGKSRLSAPLGRRLQVDVTAIDDFQLVLEASTTPAQLPLLHFWRTEWDVYSSWDHDRRLRHFIEVCRTVYEPALRAVIADHLDTGTRVILEGDFLLPELVAAMRDDPSNARRGRVRGLFVHEPDEARIAENYQCREGDPQHDRAHASWVLDRWLHGECRRLGVPIIAARPWHAVVDRAVAVLANSAHPATPPR